MICHTTIPRLAQPDISDTAHVATRTRGFNLTSKCPNSVCVGSLVCTRRPHIGSHAAGHLSVRKAEGAFPCQSWGRSSGPRSYSHIANVLEAGEDWGKALPVIPVYLENYGRVLDNLDDHI